MKPDDNSKNLQGKRSKPVFSSPSAPSTESMELAHYTIHERIGRGGMGVVFHARDTKLQRDVALKLLPSTLLASDEEMIRFRREAEAVASIVHPNVVTIYEVGEADDQPYLAMQLIDGRPLSECKDEFSGDSHRAARLLATVARAVHAAHCNGILHRDIKPSNILVENGSGEPYVADFGLAKPLEENADSDAPITLTGQVLGTPQYMSPEQAAGTNITTASDVYSLGAVFYQLLADELPIQGNSTADLLRRIVEDAPSRLRLPGGKRDADLEAVVLKCLEKEPAHRYESALTFAEDLERWLDGRPVTARPVSPPQRILRWARRKPLHATVAGLAGLFFLTLAVGGPLVAIHQSKLRSEAVTSQERAETSENLLRRELYASEMIQASLALSEPNGRHRAAELVARWRGDSLCGWEWRHLQHCLDRPVETIETYGRYIFAYDRHPDGIHFAAAGPRGLRVAKEESPDAPVWLLSPENGKVEQIEFSAEGKYLAAQFSFPERWTVFDTMSGTELLSWPCRRKENSIAWSHEPAVLARFDRSRKEVETVNVETGKIVRTVRVAPRTEREFFDWMPDGSGLLLIRKSGNIIRLPPDPTEPEEIVVESGVTHNVRAFVISPDGRQAVIGYETGTIRLLDTGRGTLSTAKDAHQAAVSEIAWSPDNEHFTTIGPGSAVHVWNADSFEREFSVFEPIRHVSASRWIRSDRFYSFSGNGRMRLWSLAEPGTFRSTGNRPLRGLSWSDDGKKLIAGWAEAIVADVTSAPPTVTRTPVPGQPTADICWMPGGEEVAFYHDYKLAVADTGFQNIRDVADYKKTPAAQRLSRFPSFPWISGTAGEGIFIANTDEERVAFAHRSDQSQNPIKIALPHPQDDESVLFYYNVGGEIFHLDIKTGEVRPFATVDSHQVSGLDFDPAGNSVAAGASDGRILLFRYPDGEQLATLSGHTSGVTDVDISPDGGRIVSASSDRTLRIWDFQNREMLAVLSGHRARIHRASWSPDGSTLASCGEDGQLRIWRTE